jgi:CBS domain-containing protein
MNIGTICRRHLVTVDGADSLQRAAGLMREHHVGAVVVTSQGDQGAQVVGMLTDRDLAIEVLARGGDASRQMVSSLARGPLVSVREDESIATAVGRMQSAGVRRLLVHDAEGHLVGLASFDDLLPACIAPLAGLAEALRRGLEREAIERGAIAAPPRPAVRVPSMGTAGWSLR